MPWIRKAFNWKILLFKKSWNMNQKLHRNIIYRCSLRLSLLLIQNQCPKLPPIQLSVYAICMGVGGKGGCSWLCLKLLTVKYNLQCKQTYFSGIFKPAISNKKKPLTHVFNIYYLSSEYFFKNLLMYWYWHYTDIHVLVHILYVWLTLVD